MPSRTDTATSAPSNVVAMRSSSALANPINPLGSHLNHFARTPGAGLPPLQGGGPPARIPETAEVVTQPPANNDSSGEQSRRSSFGNGGGSGLVMRGNPKGQNRIASASSSALPTAAASTDNSESDAADRRRQQQSQQQAGGHNRNGSRNNNGRPGPSKPPLMRSKSDYARPAPVEDSTDTLHNSGELSRWGARHGFEDHYQSEDIISQLASVRI